MKTLPGIMLYSRLQHQACGRHLINAEYRKRRPRRLTVGVRFSTFKNLTVKTNTRMTTTFLTELEINSATKHEIVKLLAVVFPDTNKNKRHFFKQLPHYRLLLRENNKLVGQMGIDYRVMSLNGELITVLGVIDLAVHPDFQGKGLGTSLMREFDKVAANNHCNVDFTFLVTDRPAFYSRLGYKPTDITTAWLKIHQGKSYGIGHEKITDSVFMFKEVSGKTWRDGELDLLGYMY